MTHKWKTLKELDLSPGDVVERRNVAGHIKRGTVDDDIIWRSDDGRDYQPVNTSSMPCYRVVSCKISEGILNEKCVVFSEMDRVYGEGTQKALRDWKHGVEIFYGEWDDMNKVLFVSYLAYRAKRAPERKTETLDVFYGKGFGVEGTAGTDWPTTHRITFETVNDEPDCSSIRMEKIE